MYIWDVTLGTMRRTLQERADGRAAAAVFDAESTRLAEALRSGAIQVSDVQTGRRLFVLKEHTDSVVSAAFSQNGRLLLSASKDKTLKFWDTETRAMIVSLKGHTGPVTAACFS